MENLSESAMHTGKAGAVAPLGSTSPLTLNALSGPSSPSVLSHNESEYSPSSIPSLTPLFPSRSLFSPSGDGDNSSGSGGSPPLAITSSFDYAVVIDLNLNIGKKILIRNAPSIKGFDINGVYDKIGDKYYKGICNGVVFKIVWNSRKSEWRLGTGTESDLAKCCADASDPSPDRCVKYGIACQWNIKNEHIFCCSKWIPCPCIEVLEFVDYVEGYAPSSSSAKSAPLNESYSPKNSAKSTPLNESYSLKSCAKSTPLNESYSPKSNANSSPLNESYSPKSNANSSPLNESYSPKSNANSSPRNDDSSPKSNANSSPRNDDSSPKSTSNGKVSGTMLAKGSPKSISKKIADALLSWEKKKEFDDLVKEDFGERFADAAPMEIRGVTLELFVAVGRLALGVYNNKEYWTAARIGAFVIGNHELLLGRSINASKNACRWYEDVGNDKTLPSEVANKLMSILDTRMSTLTFKGRCSLIDLLKDNDVSHEARELLNVRYADAVGEKASFFVSFAYNDNYFELIESLKVYLKDRPKLDGKKTYFWFDMFVNNQWKANERDFKWWASTFDQAIKSIGSTLGFVCPWHDPLIFRKAWCLFEISCTPEDKFYVVLSDKEKETFYYKNFKEYKKKVSKIDLRDANAFKATDKLNIFKKVESMEGGFDAFNKRVVKLIQDWIQKSMSELGMEEIGDYNNSITNYIDSDPIEPSETLISDQSLSLMKPSDLFDQKFEEAGVRKATSFDDGILEGKEEEIQNADSINRVFNPIQSSARSMLNPSVVPHISSRIFIIYQSIGICLTLYLLHISLRSSWFYLNISSPISSWLLSRLTGREVAETGAERKQWAYIGVVSRGSYDDDKNVIMYVFALLVFVILLLLWLRRRVSLQEPDVAPELASLEVDSNADSKSYTTEDLLEPVLNKRDAGDKGIVEEVDEVEEVRPPTPPRKAALRDSALPTAAVAELSYTAETQSGAELEQIELRAADLASEIQKESEKEREISWKPTEADKLTLRANVQYMRGNLDYARQLYADAVKANMSIRGKDHPRVFDSERNLANLLVDLGRKEEAKIHFERALEGRIRVLGPDHEDTKVSIQDLVDLSNP